MTSFGFGSGAPEGLGEFSRRVYETLCRHTAFPWPLMIAQCRRAQLDPASLTPSVLPDIEILLAEGVARFTSPEKGTAVLEELRRLGQAT